MPRFHVALLASFAAVILAPSAVAQFNISSPTTDWVAVPYGPTLLGDPQNDHQTGQGEADIVGSTGTLGTSLSSFYFKYSAGATSTTGTMHYRVRLGGDQSPSGFKSVLLIGLDANKDGKLDLFMGIDNSGQSNGIYMWRPGTGLNISPSTTSMQSKTPVKKYPQTAANYHWAAVDSASSTASVVLDPSADTALRKDFNSSTGTDYLLSFSIPFADLVAALGAQGITFNSSSAITYVMGSATQANAFNQDLNGVNGGTSSTLTWGALGVLTQPINPSGVVINSAPVNTVSGARAANGSLAVTGVSVNDADGNLATVAVTATNGTVSVSTAGGATFAAGANSTATFSLSGTQAQINAAITTLGYTPTAGFTGSASVTVLSTDTGGLTDSDSIAITVVSNPNTAPVASADSASTHAGKPVAVYVIGNDVDSDGNVLTITAATLTTGTGTVSQVNGTITFTPGTSYTGNAVINYTISDGRGGTAGSTLTVSVSANNAPVAVNDSLNTNPQTTIFINPLTNDSDANGDALTITAASRASGQGTVTLVGNEIQFDSSNSNGTTVINYTISDGYGGTASATITVTTGTNTAPVAMADTATTTAGAPVDVNVLSNDTDANVDPLIISDAVMTTGSGTALAVNGKLRFTPAAGFTGIATITYTADDGRGGTATALVTVTVTSNSAPSATGDSYSVAEDGTLTTNAPGVLTNDTDPDGNMLSAVLISGVSHGTLALNADGSFTYTPTANYNGSDSFTYQATDGSLSSSTVTVNLTVTAMNDAPMAIPDSYTVAEDTMLTIAATGVLGNDTDVEASSLSAVLVSGVNNGSLTLNANGSFTYTPAANYSGSDSFTYKANDGSLDSNTVTVSLTVTAVNDAPAAFADTYSVAEDGTLTIASPGVLGNDTDAEGSALTAALVASVSHGTLTLNANGSFSYTPAANYSGPDSFTYKANDGMLDSNTVTVSINVTAVNDAPIATADSYTVAEDSTLSVAASGVLGNDSDIDSGTLAAVLVSGPSHGFLTLNADGSFSYTPAASYNGPDSFTYKANDGTDDSNVVTVSLNVTAVNDATSAVADSYTIPQGGTLNVAAAGVLGNDVDVDGNTLTAILVSGVAHGTLSLNADGSFTYVPAAGYSGSDSFDYKANDGTADSNVVTVSLTVSAGNSAPVAGANFYTVTGGTTLNTPAPGVLANDSDPDGNTITAVLVSSTTHGTLSLNSNGSFSYTPTSGYIGTDSFSYQVTDGSLTSATATVTITVAAPAAPNRPPVLIAPTPLAATVATAVNFTIKATDPDNDPVTVTFGSPLHGSITGTGPDYTYTPVAGFAGTDSFTVTARDDRGGAVTRTIRVNVTAAAGTIGNYALHLRNENGHIAAHVLLTTTKLGRATGVLTIGGVRYTIRGFFGGPASTVLPRSKGFLPAQIELSGDNSDPTAPALVVTATDSQGGTYVGRSVRSPYSSAHPAPQVGTYTLIASRQQLILDRTGAELPEVPQGTPLVASALTARVLRSGSVVFNGSAGHGYPLVCSSYVMQNGEVPFYAGRNNPGATVQHSTFVFRSDTQLPDAENTAPAVSGTLHWSAGRDRRIPTPFEADYAVLGARFTPVTTGGELVNSTSMTLSLDIPSYATAGLATPYEDTRAFSGNLLPRITGNVAPIRVNLSTGTFITRVQGRVTRPVFGVIIQGEGIDRGLGGVVDFTSLGTCELRPAPTQASPELN